MTYDAFIDAVLDRADLQNRDVAQRITDVVLETFGEILYRTERDRIGTQLPKPLANALHAPQPENARHDGERFGPEEFLTRVKARADVNYPTAESVTPVVVNVLQSALGPGTLSDTADRLPGAYASLFGFMEPVTG